MSSHELVFVLAVIFLFSVQHGQVACTNHQGKETLHLLAMVPLDSTRSDETHCLDMGEELIPAANIAAQRINNMSDILPNFSLEIIPAKTDLCSDPSIAEALASFVNYTANPNLRVVGIIGLVCPSALLALSPIASLSTIDILQITSSTSPPNLVTILREGNISRLYQTAPSVTAFNKAIISLMENNSWREISIIRHTESISTQHDFIAGDMVKRIDGHKGINISLYVETASGLDRIINAVKMRGVRIVYATVRDSDARELLCRAYRNDVSWPNYLWILHDHSLEHLLLNNSNCSQVTMQKALNGVVLLQHRVNTNSTRDIDIVDYTYGDFQRLYNESFTSSQSPICNRKPHILSANAMHDSVLAFAQALNRSLPETDLSSYSIGSTSATINIAENLKSVNFRGAGGDISFNAITHTLIADSGVDMYQIFSGKLQDLAYYNGTEITLKNTSALSNISHTFERRFVLLPLPLPVITLIVVGVCTILTTIVLILFIYYRKAPYIKATSPLFSYIILFSCFFLFISAALSAVQYGFTSDKTYGILCLCDQWFFAIGIQAIFATLFIRLLRVSRIFFNYNPVGKAWSDQVLTLCILAIVMGTVIIHIAWTVVEGPAFSKKEDFIYNGEPPYYNVELRCDTARNPIFISFAFAYPAVFMLGVLILAIKTRKVRIDSFKDTKTVNIFVFCSVGILALCIPISLILAESSGSTTMILSFVFREVAIITVAVTCVSLLFIPKIYLAKYVKQIRTTSIGRNSLFSSSGENYVIKRT